MNAEEGRVALTKELRDGRTAVVTVTPIDYLHSAATTVTIDGNEAGRHLGPHHAIASPSFREAHPEFVAAIGPLVLTAEEAAQVEAVYREVSATIPPNLDFEREQLVSALNSASLEPAIRAAELMEADAADPFREQAGLERRIMEARAALAAFDAEHPEVAERAAARLERAVQRALEGRD